MASGKQLQLRVVGLLPDPSFHQARSCAQDLYQNNPDKFATPQIQGLLEFEWEMYLRDERKSLRGETWVFEDKAIAYLDSDLIGGPTDLDNWATQHWSFNSYRPKELLLAYAEEAYKDYLNGTGHTFVYLDISINEEPCQRLLFELYTDKCPRTCENFRALCTGEKGHKTDETLMKYHYKESIIHRIVPNGWLQGGDILFSKGDGGEAIYGQFFEDENYSVKHTSRGILGMANQGRHTNGSQYYITFQPAPWMDTKYVAFGKVIEGTYLLDFLEKQETYNERPKKECKVVDCGVFRP
ncbi:probable inactive peptidyl-prolyl cis-trans isomerase-like 6 [Asterias rubens]|uniref:probable inactive peptidyl-prolyl cis-trans isomerase-like 6 n=1 Tax=Asterias rubens TaxID=7604 RepID=UPI0014551479|nr:probable inactive peptidyl-prolyl cis-trans isomerase-like 6 [Asterias rubens]